MNYVISPFKMRGVKILKACFWHTKRDPFIIVFGAPMPGISGGDGIAAGMTPPAKAGNRSLQSRGKYGIIRIYVISYSS